MCPKKKVCKFSLYRNPTSNPAERKSVSYIHMIHIYKDLITIQELNVQI